MIEGVVRQHARVWVCTASRLGNTHAFLVSFSGTRASREGQWEGDGKHVSLSSIRSQPQVHIWSQFHVNDFMELSAHAVDKLKVRK